tara:strand:- start:3623 stop:4348 length:726 start_codon:yes stop_codon:yes gene_type:complete
MDKLLPTIEIQKPPESEPDNKLPETDNMDLMDDIVAQSEDKQDERDIINIEEREIPDEDEVFSEKTPQKISPVNNITDEEPQGEFPTEKRTKRKYVRKAPMSDKQRAHLAKMREIASEKRRLERERKAKEKEEALVAKAEKKILEKKKKEEDESLKIQRAEQEKINYQPKPEKVNGFTKEDLDNAVLSAISQYDTLRKQQKKEKREAEKKRAEEDKMRATLARAINPTPTTPNDPWRGFFT